MIKRSYLYWSVLGCALAVAAGCSTATSQKSASVDRPARSMAGSVPAQEGGAGNSKSELSLPEQPAIEAWVRTFSGRNHKSFQTQLDRSTQYVKPAQDIFVGRGLPKDLVYVALVESGFTPKARSKAKAVGMYQFIPDTGRRFGLEQNQWIDERCHPLKAARAAADYLSALYDQFGSWPLALAAYNCGERAVQSTLDRSGLKTFWELADNGYLPSETRDYVPKVLATIKIVRSPQRYGFYLGPTRHVAKQPTVSVPGGVKLSWVGKQIGVSEDVLQSCNPELCKPVTPPGCTSYNLCLPEGTGEGVLASLVERAEEEQREAFARTSSSSPSSGGSSHGGQRADSHPSVARAGSAVKERTALNVRSSSHSSKTARTTKVAAGNAGAMARGSSTKEAKETREAKGKSTPRQVALNKAAGAKPKSSDAAQAVKRQSAPTASVEGKARIAAKAPAIQNGPSPSQKAASSSRIVVASNDQDKLTSKKAQKKKEKP